MKHLRKLLAAAVCVCLAMPGAAFAQDTAGTAENAGAQTQSVQGTDLASLFYNYTKDNVVTEYTDAEYLTGPWKTQVKQYDGFLALLETDLDWDGTDELLALRLKPQEIEGKNVDSLIAEVYRREQNSLKRAAQYTLMENKMSYSNFQIDVFLLEGENSPILLCEARSVESLVATGMSWSLRAVTFDGSGFQEYARHSLDGSSFEDVDFSGITDTMYNLGLTPADPTVQPVFEQNDWLERLCTVQRYYVVSRDVLSDAAANGSTDVQYGETWFKNYVNADWENKLPKEFITAEQDGAAGQIGAGDAQNGAAGQNGAGDAQNGAAGQNSSGDAQNGGYSYSGDYVIADSDSRYLTYEELSQYSEEELLLARNEIYARRGYIFNNPDLSAYFSSKSWYNPTVSGADFTEDYASRVFNSYEITNISVIVSYEQEHGLNDYE